MWFDLNKIGSIIDYKDNYEWEANRLRNEILKRVSLLCKCKIRAGNKVAILHGGSAAFFADLFATWQIGACAICLNPALTEPEIKNIVNFVTPDLLLIGKQTHLPKNIGIPSLQTETEIKTEGILSSKIVRTNSKLDHDALILFTSGSTGEPKGVVHTFRSLLSRIILNQLHIGDEVLKNTLCVLPTHFGHGLIGNCLTALLSGKRLVLNSGIDLQRASALGRIIDEYDITFMSSVPALWKLVLRVSDSPQKETLRRVHIGSAPLSREIWQQVIKWAKTKDVVNMYGITETANWLGGASAQEFEPLDGLIGKMWGGFAAVQTEEGELLPNGEGEILVQTPSLMKEYYHRSDLTRKILHNGWFLTGDNGRIDKNGTMWLTGRKKYEINRAGIKIQPEDIDILLETHEAIQEACAFKIPNAITGESVGVAISLIEEAKVDVAGLRSWCAERLVDEKVPEKWFIVNVIPKTDRGKINRNNVAKQCLVTSPD